MVNPISIWIISHKKHEGRLPNSLICPIVMYELGNGKVVGPVFLMIVDIKMKVLLNPFVGRFQLTIGTGMVSCRNIL